MRFSTLASWCAIAGSIAATSLVAINPESTIDRRSRPLQRRVGVRQPRNVFARQCELGRLLSGEIYS
jgi:hypothetical protein